MIKFNKKYSIAGVTLQLLCDKEIKTHNTYVGYEVENDTNPDVVISYEEIEKMPLFPKECMVRDTDLIYREYIVDNKYIRVFVDARNINEYAYIYKESVDTWKLYYTGEFSNLIESEKSLFAHIPIERIMLEYNAFILHSSLINFKNNGILFSGPCRVGKSTQAALWEKYQGAEVINGDRVIIRKCNNKWLGYGSPYAGSSQIYKQKKVEVRNLIFLDKAADGKCIERLGTLKAFRRAYEQIIINLWNNDFVGSMVDMINEFLFSIETYHYFATKDEDSVIYLKEKLDLKEVK